MCLVSIQVTYETQRLYKYHKNTSQVRLLKMREIQSHNDELHRNLVRTLNIRRNQDTILQKYRLDLSSRFALKHDMDFFKPTPVARPGVFPNDLDLPGSPPSQVAF